MTDPFLSLWGMARPEKEKSKLEPITMPNGTTGYICLDCNVFCAYVEPNCVNGYRCPDCKRRKQNKL